MEFKQTFTREYLQNMPDKKRNETIQGYVDHHSLLVLQAAGAGQTNYWVPVVKYTLADSSNYVPTAEDLVMGFQSKFPKCIIRTEERVVPDGRPGRTCAQMGILVDWS